MLEHNIASINEGFFDCQSFAGPSLFCRKWIIEIPSGIPASTTDLYLPHNSITSLNASIFSNTKMLQAIVLSNNNIIR